MTLHCNQISRVHQTVNTFASEASAPNRDSRDDNRSLHRYRPMPNLQSQMVGGPANPHPQMVCGQAGRRGSWFQSDTFHTGRDAPSGRTTPEYWDGQWEGVTEGSSSAAPPNVHMRPKPVARPPMDKQARNQKKKERRGNIEMKSNGRIDENPRMSSDAAEKKQNRTDAWGLL